MLPFSLLKSLIIANQLGSYMYEIIRYRLYVSRFVSKLRYWYNRRNNQLFIYFQAVDTRVAGPVVQCQ